MQLNIPSCFLFFLLLDDVFSFCSGKFERISSVVWRNARIIRNLSSFLQEFNKI
jgi:hypothetical protein